MKINPYLGFNGQCETAFKYYEQVLGGKIAFKITYGESPMASKMPPESQKWIMHIRLQIGDTELMGGDAPPNQYTKPGGICVSLSFTDTADGERIFNALAKDGKIQMPFQKTFWSPGFGMCIDKFSIPWMINCEGTP